MIAEDYCSYEVAKLLEEKGFDEPCTGLNKLCLKDGEKPVLKVTHQKAMKWLREKYNIYINIQPDFPSDKDYKMCWCCSANILHENCISMKGWYQCYIETYEQACEEALKFSLENLI